uniref:Max-binding protein MNT n=2 Tax=Ceratitis capitata TaxID=7213 RepID=W8BPL3_CERCA
MSTGLKVLLDAAQYIEHQEKLKRSPVSASDDLTELSYVNQCSSGFNITAVNSNNNNIISKRSVRITTDVDAQVSSSAPASSATFHHITNGVIIPNYNCSLTGSQSLFETKSTQSKKISGRIGNEYQLNDSRTAGEAIESFKISPNVLISSKKASTQSIPVTDDALDESSISANQLLSNNGEIGKMIVEDGNDSPPRHSSTGSHYLQMMSAQHAIAGSHVTPSIGGTGRRRTISSNSNGAGTREVHNKLEKNRRAHLKECYEQLKNQLPLKEDERKKTSNLAILGEAIKYVKTLKKQDQDLEAEVEQLAKTKINSQLKLVSLKRELGPKYEQMFPGPFLDFDLSNGEKDNLNETASLSSGRGSILYSSSSSLSSGGSNGSTTMSSPVGPSLSQPSALSPVISKVSATNNISSSASGNNNSSNICLASKSSGTFDHNQLHQIRPTPSVLDISSVTSVMPINAAVSLGNGGIVNMSSTALSLTAKNISSMSLTRDSPTPSTPSPSPSTSSCVSSSSSLISSSPPRAINGIISGRSVTVSIPNNVKFTSSGHGTSRLTAPVAESTVGNRTSSAPATIIATSSPSNGVTSTNNAIMLQALRGCHLV